MNFQNISILSIKIQPCYFIPMASPIRKISQGQFYGQDKMIRCVEAQTVKTPAFIIQALLEDIHSHIGQGNQSDDLTLLAIKYKGIPGSK